MTDQLMLKFHYFSLLVVMKLVLIKRRILYASLRFDKNKGFSLNEGKLMIRKEGCGMKKGSL